MTLEEALLQEALSEEEIHIALMFCNGDKATIPDGMMMAFVKDNWVSLREDFIHLCE